MVLEDQSYNLIAKTRKCDSSKIFLFEVTMTIS